MTTAFFGSKRGSASAASASSGFNGFSELLIDAKPGPVNGKQKEYLTDILSSGRHLLQLINDVLDLSKVEAGRMELHPEPFALTRAIDEVCACISALAKQKGITIRKEIAPSLNDVTLDRQKYMQMLYNLLSNAVKFTDDGGEVGIVADLPQPHELRLKVRDTGIGIRREDFGKLFVEFQQLDSGATRRYEGTGLGLALTKKIVEFQGGSIAVESEAGHGSTFTVVLPVAAEGHACAAHIDRRRQPNQSQRSSYLKARTARRKGDRCGAGAGAARIKRRRTSS